MKLPLKRVYFRPLFVVVALLLVLNMYIQNNLHLQSGQFYNALEKGIRVNENGSVKLNLAALLLPAVEPSNDFINLPVLNEHKYNFINLPKNVCINKLLNLIVAIVSSIGNFDHRQLARSRRDIMLSQNVIYLFFVGKSQHMPVLQERVDEEASKYGDIVQEDFEDSGRNLSLKSVSILKWVNDYCPGAGYVIKKDDDIVLNITTALNSLEHKSKTHKHFVMGNSKYLVEGPIRDKVSKYYTSVLEYREPFFPTFVHGPAYGFPVKTAILLYQVALRTQLFWLEDVYITGICAQRAHIPVFFDKGFSYSHSSLDLF